MKVQEVNKAKEARTELEIKLKKVVEESPESLEGLKANEQIKAQEV